MEAIIFALFAVLHNTWSQIFNVEYGGIFGTVIACQIFRNVHALQEVAPLITDLEGV